MASDLVLAVAGHAPNDPANVEALLADLLHLGAPLKDGYYEMPSRYSSITIYALLTDGILPAGSKRALDILAYIDGVQFEIFTDRIKGEVTGWAKVADRVHEVDDPATALISAMNAVRSSTLLIAWDEADADDEALIHAAHAAGVQVRDAVYGLAEITPEDTGDEPEPELPEKALQEDDAPRTRKRSATPRKRQPLEETREELPDEPTSADLSVTEEPQISTASEPEPVAEPTQVTLAAGQISVDVEALRTLADVISNAAVYVRAGDALDAARRLQPVSASPLSDAIDAQVLVLQTLLYPETPYSTAVAETTASEKPAKPEKAIKVVWDEDAQEWRKAGRGRVRAGTRVGMMDVAGKVVEYQN